jgi:hypothetical protein
MPAKIGDYFHLLELTPYKKKGSVEINLSLLINAMRLK